MKTIREKAKAYVESLDYKTLNDWAIKDHTSQTHMWVQVYPDGQVSETEEADNNTTHWIDYPDKEVLSVYEISTASCEPCNCDICCMYRHYEDCDGDKEEFLYSHSEDDWDYCQENTLEQALRDCDYLKSTSDIREEMLDAIDEIYYGYFDDENVKKMIWEEYNASSQDTYLDEDNAADCKVVYENGAYNIRVLKTFENDEDHFFSGEDEDFVIIDGKYPEIDSFLLYNCTLKEAIDYVEAEIN